MTQLACSTRGCLLATLLALVVFCSCDLVEFDSRSYGICSSEWPEPCQVSPTHDAARFALTCYLTTNAGQQFAVVQHQRGLEVLSVDSQGQLSITAQVESHCDALFPLGQVGNKFLFHSDCNAQTQCHCTSGGPNACASPGLHCYTEDGSLDVTLPNTDEPLDGVPNSETAHEGSVVFSGEVIATDPLTSCTPLTNSEEVSGKIAFLRYNGGCWQSPKAFFPTISGAKAIIWTLSAAGEGGPRSVMNTSIPMWDVNFANSNYILDALKANKTVNCTFGPGIDSSKTAAPGSAAPGLAAFDLAEAASADGGSVEFVANTASFKCASPHSWIESNIGGSRDYAWIVNPDGQPKTVVFDVSDPLSPVLVAEIPFGPAKDISCYYDESGIGSGTPACSNLEIIGFGHAAFLSSGQLSQVFEQNSKVYWASYILNVPFTDSDTQKPFLHVWDITVPSAPLKTMDFSTKSTPVQCLYVSGNTLIASNGSNELLLWSLVDGAPSPSTPISFFGPEGAQCADVRQTSDGTLWVYWGSYGLYAYQLSQTALSQIGSIEAFQNPADEPQSSGYVRGCRASDKSAFSVSLLAAPNSGGAGGDFAEVVLGTVGMSSPATSTASTTEVTSSSTSGTTSSTAATTEATTTTDSQTDTSTTAAATTAVTTQSDTNTTALATTTSGAAATSTILVMTTALVCILI